MGMGWGGLYPGPVAPWSGVVGVHVSLGAGLGNQALPSPLEGGLYPGPLAPVSLPVPTPPPRARLSRPVFQRLAPLLVVLVLGVPPGSWQPSRPLPSFLPARAFSCLSRPFLPRSSKQTNKPAAQAQQARPRPARVCSCGGGELCGPACGGGRPAAGAPPALPPALHPFRAATSKKPLCLLLQSETLQCPRLAKWRWGNCSNTGVTSPSWLQTPISLLEECVGRLPSGG